MQCIALWLDASVVYNEQHEDAPKSALFMTTTAVKRNENEKTIEYNLKRSVESEDVIAFRVLFEMVEEVRLFVKSMDYIC